MAVPPVVRMQKQAANLRRAVMGFMQVQGGNFLADAELNRLKQLISNFVRIKRLKAANFGIDCRSPHKSAVGQVFHHENVRLTSGRGRLAGKRLNRIFNSQSQLFFRNLQRREP